MTAAADAQRDGPLRGSLWQFVRRGVEDTVQSSAVAGNGIVCAIPHGSSELHTRGGAHCGEPRGRIRSGVPLTEE